MRTHRAELERLYSSIPSGAARGAAVLSSQDQFQAERKEAEGRYSLPRLSIMPEPWKLLHRLLLTPHWSERGHMLALRPITTHPGDPVHRLWDKAHVLLARDERRMAAGRVTTCFCCRALGSLLVSGLRREGKKNRNLLCNGEMGPKGNIPADIDNKE